MSIITISYDDSSTQESTSFAEDHGDEDTAAVQICTANSLSEVSIPINILKTRNWAISADFDVLRAQAIGIMENHL